jgi:hypothetical protein
LVCVVYTVAVSVGTSLGIGTITYVSGGRIIVASTVVLAARDFVLITNLVAVRVHQAISVAVVSGISINARAVIVCRVAAVVA